MMLSWAQVGRTRLDDCAALRLGEDECGLVRMVLLKAKRIRSSQLEVTDYRRQVPKLPSRRPFNHLAPRGLRTASPGRSGALDSLRRW